MSRDTITQCDEPCYTRYIQMSRDTITQCEEACYTRYIQMSRDTITQCEEPCYTRCIQMSRDTITQCEEACYTRYMCTVRSILHSFTFTIFSHLYLRMPKYPTTLHSLAALPPSHFSTPVPHSQLVTAALHPIPQRHCFSTTHH
jgi:hypothetical protein